MKTLVISLAKISERRKYILEHVKECNLDFTLIDAVDGSLLSDEVIAQIINENELKKNGWKLKKGAIGCLLSHKKAYQYIVDNNLKSALVIEDDVAFPININKLLMEIDDELASSEVILLYYGAHKACRLSIIGKTDLNASYSLVYPTEMNLTSAAAYIISNKAAEKMLTSNTPLLVVADCWWYFYHRESFSSFRLLYPSPLKTKNFKSTIDYINPKTLKGILSRLINTYKIPLLFQIITNLRIKRENKILNHISLTDEISPIYQKLKV